MKKLLIFGCTVLFAFGCNDKSGSSDAKTGKMDYPYSMDRPYQDWQPGDQKHVVNVMKGLKAWETNNMAEAVTYFGDNVELRFDNYLKTLPHDSLANFLAMGRVEYASVTIEMGDWISVISKNGKEEWVTLWYKQKFTDKTGKSDSLAVVNDAKIVKGKIVVLDEKVQHYPATK